MIIIPLMTITLLIRRGHLSGEKSTQNPFSSLCPHYPSGEYLRNVYNASINPDDLDEEKEPFNKKKNSGHQDYHDQNTATTSSKGGEGSSGKGVGERERMGNQTGDNPQAHSQDCPSDMINLHSSSAAAVEY